MGRTYRTSKLAVAGLLPHDRIIKDVAVRPCSRPLKKFIHRQDRRQVQREIQIQLQEAL